MGIQTIKAHKKGFIIGVLAVLLVLLLGGVAVYSVNRQDTPEVYEEEEAVRFLREQLADETVTDVTITGNLPVVRPLTVAGTKNISGDGVITVQEDVTFSEGILELEAGAELTLLSGSVNAASSANGIYVPEKATLHVEGGEISFAASWNVYSEGETDISDGTIYYAQENNIYTTGALAISGGTISDAGAYNVYQAEGSKVTMTGGALDSAGVDNLYGEASSTLSVSGEKTRIRNAAQYGINSDGEVTIDYVTMTKNLIAHIQIGPEGSLELNDGYLNGSSGYGVRNSGTMVMNGGEISSNALSGVANMGELTVNAGTIMFNTERAITNKIGATLTVNGRDVKLSGSTYGLYNEEDAVATLTDVVIENNNTSNIRNFGTVYLSDSDLLDCGSNSISNYRNGYISLTNVNIERTVTNHAIYNDRGEVEFSNVTVKDVSSRAIQNKGGIVKGSNLTAMNCAGAVVGNNEPNDTSQGEMVIEGLVTSGVESNNVYCENGSISIVGGTLAVSPKNSVRVTKGDVNLTNVTIQGTIKPGENASYGVYTSAGKTTLRNVTIQNTASQAINNRGGSVLMYDVRIINPGATAIHNRLNADTGAGGNIYGERVTVTGSVTANVNNEGEGTTVTLKDSTLGVTPKTNVIATAGTVVLDGTEVLGTNGDDQKPNFYIASDATGVISGNTVISGAFGKGVNNQGTFHMYGGTIEKNTANAGAGLTNDGTAVISGGTIRNNVALTASGGGILNNSNAELTMSNMEISGNTTNTIGGGLALADGSICTMTGGTVSGNVAKCQTTSNAGGGGVNVAGGARFYFLGGSFGGNRIAETNTSGVACVGDGIRVSSPSSMLYMGGNASVQADNSIYLHNEAVIYIKEMLTAAEPIRLEIRKYVYGQEVLAEGSEGQSLVASAAGKFSLVEPWYINTKGNLGSTADLSDEAVARIYNPGSSEAQEDGYIYYTSLGLAIMDVVDGGTATIELVADPDISYLITIDGAKNITLTDDGEARTIRRAQDYTSGRLFCITGKSTLTLAGSSNSDDRSTLIFDGNGVTTTSNGQFIMVGNSSDTTASTLHICAGVTLQNASNTSGSGSALAVYAGNLIMDGGRIINNANGATAGTINVASHASVSNTFTMNGGTISGNRIAQTTGTSYNGAAVNLAAGAEGSAGSYMVMNGGTISGNTATSYGGGVNVGAYTTFTMNGGTISDNKASLYRGGGVNVGTNGRMIMSGGCITGNSAKTQGGGICLENGAQLTMTGGNVTDNTAGSGEDIELHYANNSLTLGGSPVIGSLYFFADSGSAVTLQDGFVVSEAIPVTVKTAAAGYRVLADGTYTDEQLAMFAVTDPTYKIDTNGTLTYGGGYVARILQAGGSYVYYYTLADAVDAVSAQETATIELIADVTVSGMVTIDEGRNITLTDDGTARSIYRAPGYTSGRLFCITGQSALTLAGSSNSDDKITLALDGNGVTTTSNGQFVMVGNASDTTASTLNIKAGVAMQNAKNTSGSGAALAIYAGSINMDGGKIINNTNGATAGAVNVASNSAVDNTFTMNGGTISGNKISQTTGTGYNGAAVNLAAGKADSGSTYMIMNGGTISGNTATSYGGGVNVGGYSTFTMNGGTISDNTTSLYRGGGVNVGTNGRMVMTGGTITGNKAKTQGGGICLESAAVLTMTGGTVSGNTAGSGKDIELHYANNKLTLGGSPTIGDIYFYAASGSSITLQNGLTVTEAIPVTVASAAAGYRVLTDGSYTDAQLAMFAMTDTTYKINAGGVLAYDGYTVRKQRNGGGYDYYYSLADAVAAVSANETAVIELMADVTVSGMITIDNGRNITLTDDGTARSIYRAPGYTSGRLFCITGQSALTLAGSSNSDDKITLALDGNGVTTTSNGQFVMVGNASDTTASTLNIKAGVAMQNAKNTSGSGAALAIYAGSINMDGGKIINNTNGATAGAVNVASNSAVDNTFTMNGGTISGNKISQTTGTGYNGAAVNLAAGKADSGSTYMIMNGGTISGNTATSYGGGVNVGGYSTFTMNGGTISDNTTSLYRGGGVNVGTNGRMVMTGGTITGNKAKTQGGGICLESAAVLTMTGGTVSGNTAAAGADLEIHYTNNKVTLGGSPVVGSLYFFADSGSTVTLQDGFVVSEAIPVTVKTAAAGYRVLANGSYTDAQLAMFTMTDTAYKISESGVLTNNDNVDGQSDEAVNSATSESGAAGSGSPIASIVYRIFSSMGGDSYV